MRTALKQLRIATSDSSRVKLQPSLPRTHPEVGQVELLQCRRERFPRRGSQAAVQVVAIQSEQLRQR